MISPIPPRGIWICLLLLALFGDHGIGAQAETSLAPGGVKVSRYPNMDAPGNDATWVRGIASVAQCESLCLASRGCAGYTYNVKQSACFEKTAIGPLAPSRDPTVTGVVERIGGGQAAQGRAIKVEGKPSFDCRNAHGETEGTICTSPELSRLDVQLTNLYWSQIAKLKGANAEEEKRRQHDWGVARNQCGLDTGCVEQSYQRRIAEFGGKSLPPATQQGADRKPQPMPDQKMRPPEAPAPRPKGPIATVQQLPNPIRLIGKADQPCDVASVTLARLRKTLSISVPDGLTVQAESLRTFTWKVSGAPPLGPAYLVLAADGPVRVQGTGFYALTPEAKAPFRIKQFLKDTRVIIPLHVKGAPTSGEVKIRPLIAGPLKVSAAIIGYTQCGENSDPAPIAFDLTIEPGAPEIVIADRFDLAKPNQIIASPDGTRRLEIYGPRYRLIDVATGALLADEIGKEPRFSPTARFFSANVENNFEIRDSLDGKAIRQRVSDDWRGEIELAWDDRDSFLIAHDSAGEGSEYGVILNSLEEKDVTDIQCCDREDIFSNFRLDLENNFAISDIGPNGNGWKGASSLTIHAKEKQEASAELSDSLLAAPVFPYTTPKRWETIDHLKFTQLLTYNVEDEKYGAALKPFLIRPIIISKGEVQVLAVNNEPLRTASRGVEKINLPEAEFALRRDQRLHDIGIGINPGVPFLKPDRTKNRLEGLELLAIGQADGFRLTLFASEGGGDGFIEQYAHLDDSRRPGQLFDLNGLDSDEGGFRSNCFFDNSKCGFSAELFYNRYLIVWPKGRSAAAVYDVEERKLMAYLDDLPSPDVIQRISISKDLNTVVKLDKDGGFQVIAFKLAQKDAEGHLTQASTKVNVLLSGRIVDDEVVVWTPSGQFDSTAEGASHVAVRFPGRSGEYTLEQFHKQFHVNNLLKRALAGEEFRAPRVHNFPPAIAVKPIFTSGNRPKNPGQNLSPHTEEAQRAVSSFDKLRMKGEGASGAVRGPSFETPASRAPQEEGEAFDTGSGTITAKINVLGDDPVEEVRVYQDGLMTGAIPVAAGAKTIDVNAKRLPGARWVAFLARGPSGLYSQPATFDAGPGAAPRRRVHLISIGIDHYDDATIQQLRFAGSDAARFVKALQDKAGSSVEIVSQTLLRNADASREAILTKLNETIAKADPGDSILLFIAGHGIQTADKNYYLATSATRKDDIPNTSLRWSDLSGALAKAHSRIAVFLDTCQSGAAGTDFFAPNDASVSALLDRAPSGILIFSASKGRELSEESADHGGGVFTSSVIAALSDLKTDRNRNGVIEASELYASVKRAVVEATQGRQTPWFARNDMVGDFVPF
ncbi:MAG TPA: caspase family protein [Methylocella sp.]|jgi:hypothetical protein